MVQKGTGRCLAYRPRSTKFQHPTWHWRNAQVTHAVLKSGEKIETDMVLVGVGARPNTELVKGQLELLEERPGGIKVSCNSVTGCVCGLCGYQK